MIALAFKVAAQSGDIYSRAIAWKTGGKFSHVEGWLSGLMSEATCFSARNPYGTGYKVIDLSDEKLWTIVRLNVTPEQERLIKAFCEGTGHKSYDWWGILGFVLPWGTHDDEDRFCSELWTEVLQKTLGWFTSGGRYPELVSWKTDPTTLYHALQVL